jgi:hypothetical protein
MTWNFCAGLLWFLKELLAQRSSGRAQLLVVELGHSQQDDMSREYRIITSP